jgi:hypothetical protein
MNIRGLVFPLPGNKPNTLRAYSILLQIKFLALELVTASCKKLTGLFYIIKAIKYSCFLTYKSINLQFYFNLNDVGLRFLQENLNHLILKIQVETKLI